MEEAVIRSLNGAMSWERKLFVFARDVKARPHLAEIDLPGLASLAVVWHEGAVASGLSVDVGDVVRELLSAWQQVRHPLGEGPIDLLWDEAGTLAPSPLAKAASRLARARVDRPLFQRLVGLLQLLQQRAGDAPFFIGTRTAGRLLGKDHTVAWRWLNKLQRMGVLETVEVGSVSTGRASRFRFVG